MSEETKVLIDKPGRYPMRDGRMATVFMVGTEPIYPVLGAHEDDKGHMVCESWTLSGKFIEGDRDESFDIIGPRLIEPDHQDGIVDVESMPRQHDGHARNEDGACVICGKSAMECLFEGPCGMPKTFPAHEVKPTKPTPMQRYGAYAAKWPTQVKASHAYYGVYSVYISRLVNGIETACFRGQGATPDEALAAAMDVLEGLA